MNGKPLSDLSNQELLDRDLAIMVATAPIWLTWFAVRIVAAAWNDWRSGVL